MFNIDISNIETQTLIDFAENNINDFSNFELSITFKSDYSQSRIVRSFILYLFEKNSIDVPWKNRFSLISDELINNSIEYGSMPLDKNIFYISFKKSSNSIDINLEVHDTGKGLFAKNSKQMELIRKEKTEETKDIYLGKRGRGLFQLVTNIVDELYFKDKPGGGLIVGINKKLEI